jgi:hypothetical protein
LKLTSQLSRRQPWAIAVSLSIATYALMFATFGIQFKLLSFNNVYDVRAVFEEQASGPLNYLLDWQANVVNPLFISYGIVSRRSLPVVAGILGDFLIYSITGYKWVLFSAFAVTAVLFTLRQKDPAARAPAIGMRLGLAFDVLVAASYVIDKMSHSIVWTSLFIRRLSLVAGVNTGYYFQYFSFAPKTHLAYGLIGAIYGNSGATPPPQQISFAVYHSLTGDPNVNIWADAYANFGFTGVIAFTLILAGFLWLYDRVAYNSDRGIATVLITVSAMTMANSALFTCLLTHGMLLALLVVTLCPRLAHRAEQPQGQQVHVIAPSFHGSH